MDYQEAEIYLNECSLLGSRPGLTAIKALVNKLDNPQDSLRLIHIAGTNGKGSIGVLLESVLTEAGYKVGFFTSPFLETRREMIRLGGKQISEESFAAVISTVKNKADEMVCEGYLHPTEFELMTAAAFEFFRREKCDFSIVEAGMGGRLDATNIMKSTAISILSRIDYDHTAFLGDTLTDITREKCGIFRHDCPVVVYPDQEAETLSVIQSEAEKKNCPLIMPLKTAVSDAVSDDKGSRFSYGKLKNLEISLCGAYQIYNALTALLALSVLSDSYGAIPEEAIRKGLLKASWSGRFEVLSDRPLIVIDGAHNINGVRGFVEGIRICFPKQRFVGVVGMLRDKDFQSSLEEFGKVCDRFVLTEVPNPRSASVEELKQVADQLGIPATAVKNPTDAVAEAFLKKTPDQALLCAGSLYALTSFRKGCEKIYK